MGNNKENKKILRKKIQKYLSRYYHAVSKKKILENRLRTLTENARNPLRGVNYDPLPRSESGSPGAGAAGFTYALDELQERIIEQQGRINEIVVNTLDMIDHLEEGTREKDIVEYRYIDCMSWKDIMKKMHLTQSPCYEYHNKALNQLASSPRVIMIVNNFFEKNESQE